MKVLKIPPHKAGRFDAKKYQVTLIKKQNDYGNRWEQRSIIWKVTSTIKI